jgi:zinc protease
MKKQLILFTLIVIFASIVSAQVKPSETKKPDESRASAGNVKLPTAKEIFDKYVESAGGRSVIEKIKSRKITGTVELPAMGLKGAFELISKSPDKSAVIINLNGFGEITEAFDGKQAWSSNPLEGQRVKTGNELEETRKTSGFHSFDLHLEKTYPKAVVTSLEKMGGADVYVVKADADTTIYFDKQSGLIIQMNRVVTSPQGRINSITKFEDFRVVDGYKMAFKMTQSAVGADFVFNTAEVRHNIEIADNRFSKSK